VPICDHCRAARRKTRTPRPGFDGVMVLAPDVEAINIPLLCESIAGLISGRGSSL